MIPIRKPQRLPDPNIPWVKTDGRPTDAFFQYMREMDDATRKLIDAVNALDIRVTELEMP